MNNHIEIAKHVRSIRESLTQYQADAKKFNSREVLFEKETTDY